MARAPTEMVNSYVFLVDLSGKEMSNDEIKVKVEEGDRTLVISYLSSTQRFDLPKYVNLDAISAISQNDVLLVIVNKVNRVMTERTIKVTKVEI
ncbi:hypothetical protein MKX01_035855 [Papaver californicum]|nr:hypothetical protein MKX01_035855 [Papaver californicum]